VACCRGKLGKRHRPGQKVRNNKFQIYYDMLNDNAIYILKLQLFINSYLIIRLISVLRKELNQLQIARPIITGMIGCSRRGSPCFYVAVESAVVPSVYLYFKKCNSNILPLYIELFSLSIHFYYLTNVRL